MKIRFATRNDIPTCTEIGRRMVTVTRFAAYDFNAERLLAQNPGAVIDSMLAHNLVCALMVRTGAGAGTAPRSLSAKGTVQLYGTFKQQLRLTPNICAKIMNSASARRDLLAATTRSIRTHRTPCH